MTVRKITLSVRFPKCQVFASLISLIKISEIFFSQEFFFRWLIIRELISGRSTNFILCLVEVGGNVMLALNRKSKHLKYA